MKNTLEEFPILESIKADYPDSITSARNVELVEEWDFVGKALNIRGVK